MAMQDIVVPEAESISASASSSENEESLSSGGGSSKKGEKVKTTLTATADTAEAAPVENNTSTKKTATKNTRKKYKPRIKDPTHMYPVAPRVIHHVHRPKTHVNHSYSDFSGVPPEKDYYKTAGEPANVNNDMTFAQKVHHMLSQPENQGVIAWLPHGRAWRVLRPSDLERNVMPTYFGHSRYSHFLSLIRQSGLKHITQGPDKGSLYHECMLRGLPHLAAYMPLLRTPKRLTDDPVNEPDFYSIANLYPLPDPINNKSAEAVPAVPTTTTTPTPILLGTSMAPQCMTMSSFPQAISHTVATIGGQSFIIPSLQTIPTTAAGTTMLVASPNGTRFFLMGTGGLPLSFAPQMLQPQVAAAATFVPAVGASGNCSSGGDMMTAVAPVDMLSQPPAAAAAAAAQDTHY